MLIHSLWYCRDSRGSIQSIWPGNGTNFFVANSELQKALTEMDHLKVKNCLQGKGTD